MSLSQEFLEELELLKLFNLDNSAGGLKIHHQAAPARITAAARLFKKKMISLVDGGYLTPRGVEAAAHAQALVTMLQASK
jgi:uncharacterized protein (TIGR02647 family)